MTETTGGGFRIDDATLRAQFIAAGTVIDRRKHRWDGSVVCPFSHPALLAASFRETFPIYHFPVFPKVGMC